MKTRLHFSLFVAGVLSLVGLMLLTSCSRPYREASQPVKQVKLAR